MNNMVIKQLAIFPAVNWASPSAQGASFTSLENRLLLMSRPLNKETNGKLVTKSIDQLAKGQSEIGKGNNTPQEGAV